MTFKKFDSGKPRPELIPPQAIHQVAKVLAYGAAKYSTRDEDGNVVEDGADNWHKGCAPAIPRYICAALRHINAYQRGEPTDDETGLAHLAHAVCCLLFAHELQDRALSEQIRAYVAAHKPLPHEHVASGAGDYGDDE